MSWFKTGWQPSAADAALNNYVRARSYHTEDPVQPPVDPAILEALHAPTPPPPQPQAPTPTSTLKKTAIVGAAGVAGVIGVKVAENIVHQKLVTPVVNAATEHGPGILASAAEAIGGAADTIYDATLGMIFGPWISAGLGYTTPSFVKRITVGGVSLGAMYGIFMLYNSCRYPYGYPVVGGGGTQTNNNNIHISVHDLPRLRQNTVDEKAVGNPHLHVNPQLIATALTPEQKQKVKRDLLRAAVCKIPAAIKSHDRVTSIVKNQLGLLSNETAAEIVKLKERFDELEKAGWVKKRLRLDMGVASLILESAEHELATNEKHAKAVVHALTDRRMHAMHIESENKANEAKTPRRSDRIAEGSSKKRKINKF